MGVMYRYLADVETKGIPSASEEFDDLAMALRWARCRMKKSDAEGKAEVFRINLATEELSKIWELRR